MPETSAHTHTLTWAHSRTHPRGVFFCRNKIYFRRSGNLFAFLSNWFNVASVTFSTQGIRFFGVGDKEVGEKKTHFDLIYCQLIFCEWNQFLKEVISSKIQSSCCQKCFAGMFFLAAAIFFRQRRLKFFFKRSFKNKLKFLEWIVNKRFLSKGRLTDPQVTVSA